MAGSLPKPSPQPTRPLMTKRPVAAPAAGPKPVAAKAASVPASKLMAKPLGKPMGKPGARPLAKSASKKATTPRGPVLPRERKTLDGPWEWAFDRMLERKRAADALVKQEARQAARRAAAPRTPPAPSV